MAQVRIEYHAYKWHVQSEREREVQHVCVPLVHLKQGTGNTLPETVKGSFPSSILSPQQRAVAFLSGHSDDESGSLVHTHTHTCALTLSA